MQQVILADASALIVLDNIGELQLLTKLFSSVCITAEVLTEFGKPMPSGFELKTVKDKTYQAILEASLDKGEASTIACALENKGSLVILDERRGRQFAKQLGLLYTGTLGIMLEAKRHGHIASIRNVIIKMKAEGFRMSESLERTVLNAAGEA